MNEEVENTQEAPKAETAKPTKTTRQKGWFARNWGWVAGVGAVLLAAGAATVLVLTGGEGEATTAVA